jgi:hypothetical protein
MARYSDVIRELKRSLAIKPDSATTRGWLAWSYVRIDDLAAASEQQTLIAQLDPALADEVAALILKSKESRSQH